MRLLVTPLLVGLLAVPARAQETGPAPREVVEYQIPYQLTLTKHVMVRVKLNGKGPFNFIIDTGAPALIMTEAVAKKVGGKADEGWTTFDRLDIEGGITIPKARGVAIDMFQLKGMNSMGLAGVELHGVIGYNVLAKYRITYDFNEPKLRWVPTNYEVPPPKRIVDKGGSQGGLEMIGNMMQMLAALGGIKANFAVQPRGFLGAEVEAQGDDVVIKSVLEGGPAAKAGLQAGDRIQTAKGKTIAKPADLLDALSKLPEGSTVKLAVKRGDAMRDVSLELGKGL